MISIRRGSIALALGVVVTMLGRPTAGDAQVNDEAARSDRLQYLDVFEMEVSADPRISPDGSRIVYVRQGFDIMTDRRRTALWMLDADGADHRALTDGNSPVSSPRWSPDGNRLLYVSSEGGSSQIFVRWMDSGQIAELTNVTESPGNLTWSPDGNWIAMTMHVPEAQATFAKMPPRPDGAQWNDPPLVVDRLRYRADGRGYLPRGHTHVFVMPADGGTPRHRARSSSARTVATRTWTSGTAKCSRSTSRPVRSRSSRSGSARMAHRSCRRMARGSPTRDSTTGTRAIRSPTST
jgi:acylaminoacyl-peptidase